MKMRERRATKREREREKGEESLCPGVWLEHETAPG